LHNLLKLTCFILWLVGLNNLHAQTGTWNILQLRYKHSDRISLFAEGQVRSLGFYTNYHYHEIKGGINFKLAEGFQYSLAMGDYDTYREGGDFVEPKRNDEFRIWNQLLLHQQFPSLQIEHRYRLESRFTLNGYRNRIRYRLGTNIPFKPFKLKGLQWHLSNEIFFTDLAPYFERNRVQIALQWRLNKSLALQGGYLHQFDYKINDETGRSFFQIGMYIDLKRKEKKTDKEPQKTEPNLQDD